MCDGVCGVRARSLLCSLRRHRRLSFSPAAQDYVNGEGDMQHAAMGHMLAHGFSKYDDHIGVAPTPDASVDTGVLSIRDYILSTQADLYVTCAGDHWATCHGCFRAGSNLVQRITQHRQQLGKPSHTTWFSLTKEHVPAAFADAAAAAAPA